MVAKVQEHWTARHAVHIWDRLELSRSQMEVLHHLLSFIYDPELDSYIPIKVWENEDDPGDFVLTAKLASRQSREREYKTLADGFDIVVGSNGRCERYVRVHLYTPTSTSTSTYTYTYTHTYLYILIY